MKRFFIALTLPLLAVGNLICGQAVAQEREGTMERLNIPGIGAVPYQKLFEEKSLPGESLDQFMVRIGPRLREYSDRTEFEACGMIARKGDTYGVIVGSNHAHIACVNVHSFVPTGMTSINESVHSHGGERSFNANRSDKALMGAHLLPGRKNIAVHGQSLDAFSSVDIEGGAGYLAIPGGRLLHQTGHKNSIREVVGLE